jgi:hypothetical protein
MDKIDFRLGHINAVLEIPPFFVNFDKRAFSSMMTRVKKRGRKALFYVYITRSNQLSKLLLLKALHPDIFIPETIKIDKEEMDKAEVNSFIESFKKLETEWSYLRDDRWTVRPMVSKETILGYGVEIPVDKALCDSFLQELHNNENIDLEMHEHVDNRHYHFTVYSIDRFISLVKKWDYYFSHKERWKMSIKIEAY